MLIKTRSGRLKLKVVVLLPSLNTTLGFRKCDVIASEQSVHRTWS